MDVLTVFLVISVVLFFGFLAEFIFRKTSIPDVLLLVLLGLLLGQYGLNLVQPEQIRNIAPIFTTFALLFLLYDGSFRIDLASFTREFSKSMQLTWFNFFVSAFAIASVMMLASFDLKTALLLGFILGGISSAFVIPLLRQLNASKPVISLLTLESAFTDVICIVFSLTMMDLIQVGTFSIQTVSSTIVSLFAVAGFVGVVGGIFWVIVLTKVLRHSNTVNMITVAFLLVVYVVTEYLHGNGAIAGLFFGIVLKNSLQLKDLLQTVVSGKEKRNPSLHQNNKVGISITTFNEEDFYTEIAFFVKTLFFVYIGILLNFSNLFAVLIGIITAFVAMAVRPIGSFIISDLKKNDKMLVNAMFARGIAAAVIAQIAVQRAIPDAVLLSEIIMVFILGTIVLSSIRIFLYQRATVIYR